MGSNLAATLMSADHDVKCLVRENADLSLLPANANIFKINYADKTALKQVLADCDIIVHTAALTRAKKWADFKKINIELTETLVDIARQNKQLERFVFISSQAAAGPANDPERAVCENDDCKPISWYGKSKLLAEQIVKKAGLPYTIIRPVSVFGAGDKDFMVYFKLIKNNLAPFIGFKKKYMSLIYIDDLTEIILHVLENRKAENETFFAASTSRISMQEFVRILKKVMQKKTINIYIPHILLDLTAFFSELLNFSNSKPPVLNRQKAQEFKQKYWLVNSEKAIEFLNYPVESDLQENLKITYDWYKERGWL